jgi:glutamate dehydrogenase (NADP+)
MSMSPARPHEPDEAARHTLEKLYAQILRRNPGEKEFHQAAREVLESLAPVFARRPEFVDAKIIERICEPERPLIFRVPCVDDAG